MDPKMDSGCIAAGESLDEDYDVTRPLLPKEVLGIIDQMLCHEVCTVFLGRFSPYLTLSTDGLASRAPSIPDTIYERVYRVHLDAASDDDRRGRLL
jgi:hypothetical protein